MWEGSRGSNGHSWGGKEMESGVEEVSSRIGSRYKGDGRSRKMGGYVAMCWEWGNGVGVLRTWRQLDISNNRTANEAALDGDHVREASFVDDGYVVQLKI